MEALSQLLTYSQVCERYGIPRGTLSRWVHERKIPHIRIGPRTVRFDPAEIYAWLDARRVGAA